MKVRVLGCSGAIAQGCRTTAFLIEGRVLIDAGTGVGDLTLEEMRQIDHVLLTHSHLDHVAALPLMLDAVSSLRSAPVQVHALPRMCFTTSTQWVLRRPRALFTGRIPVSCILFRRCSDCRQSFFKGA